MERLKMPSASRDDALPCSMPSVQSQSWSTAGSVYRPNREISQTATRGTVAKSVSVPSGTTKVSFLPR
jgi:hypothetical protein